MSKLFNDPVYRDMSESEEGWLELAIEPFRFELNNIIAMLPEQVELNFEFLRKWFLEHFDDMYITSKYRVDIVEELVKTTLNKTLTRHEINTVASIFELKVSKDTVLNLVDNTLSAPIFLVKTKDQFDEQETLQLVSELAIRHIDIHSNYKNNTPRHSAIISRQNHIMDLIDAKNERNSRSLSKKTYDICETMRKIIKEDLWRLRDAQLIVNACTWITSYVNDGNQHALMNFTRLKCMTHKDVPIYSMEEIV